MQTGQWRHITFLKGSFHNKKEDGIFFYINTPLILEKIFPHLISPHKVLRGFPQLVKNLPARWEPWVPWVEKIPWRRERLPTPVFWPGEFHGLCSPWGCKEPDMTEQFSLSSRCLKGSNYSSYLVYMCIHVCIHSF